jgi:hypothetical protein
MRTFTIGALTALFIVGACTSGRTVAPEANAIPAEDVETAALS